MKITREINGEYVDFELTKDEMKEAGDECQHLNDRQSMEEYIGLHHTEESLQREFGKGLEEAKKDIDMLACLLRRNIEEFDFTWEEARHEALVDWVCCDWTNKS